ncbi:MAG TPA: hypothetical protein DEQ34_06595 [Balneolaceae bacterium]|nr:hypothetical protein [Balneolaceae bacterium]|tara:strand:+ start:145980 stop:146933 length:954 start_codon:yes stop_codon:yes gene_type:complete
MMVLGLGYSVQAQELSKIPGSFVDVGFGTRPVGMGFAFVGLADDENSPYWNPAGLSQINEYKAGFAQIDQLGLITYNYASVLVPLPFKNQAAGLTVISSGDDAMSELSIHAAYGMRFKFVSIGAGFKYRSASFGNNSLNRDDYIVFDDAEIDAGFGQQIYGDANGFGFDLGLLFHPYESIKFGVMIRDAMAPMNWNSQTRGSDYQARGTYDEGMPMEVIIGSSAKISNNFLVVADFQPAMSDERTNYARVGVEGRLVNILMLRAGTEQGINDLDDEKYTLGTGLDVTIKDKIRLQSDFAYVIDPIQNSQRISFTISF